MSAIARVLRSLHPEPAVPPARSRSRGFDQRHMSPNLVIILVIGVVAVAFAVSERVSVIAGRDRGSFISAPATSARDGDAESVAPDGQAAMPR
jgi:hypothetical protein